MAVDRLPRRNVICFGVLVWAAAATCCGLAQNFPQLLAARTLVGAGEAALAPAA
jgi:MFS family permease